MTHSSLVNRNAFSEVRIHAVGRQLVMPQEIAAAPFISLGNADVPFLDGLRADVLSALAARTNLKVYSASFDPTHDAQFAGHTLHVAASRTETHLMALCSLQAPAQASRAESLHLELAQISNAAARIAELASALLTGQTPRSSTRTAEATLTQAAYEHLLLGRHHASAFTPAGNEAALALTMASLAPLFLALLLAASLP